MNVFFRHYISAHAPLFEFPPEGSLQPLETLRLQIAFKPLAEIIVSTQFSLVVENGNVVHCNCFAQAQRSSASFLESHVYADSLYVNVESIAIAKLCNHSVIQAEFTFGKPEGRAG